MNCQKLLARVLPRAVLFVGCVVVAGIASACSGSSATACTPGEQADCGCSDGRKGAKVCSADGLGFGACACLSTGDGGGAPGATNGAGPTGGSGIFSGSGGSDNGASSGHGGSSGSVLSGSGGGSSACVDYCNLCTTTPPGDCGSACETPGYSECNAAFQALVACAQQNGCMSSACGTQSEQLGACLDMTTTTSSSSSSSGAGGGGGGTGTEACLTTGSIKECQGYKNLTPAEVSEIQMDCASANSTAVSKCPRQGLVGCCVESTTNIVTETCYYQGTTETPTQCTDSGGTWSTTP